MWNQRQDKLQKDFQSNNLKMPFVEWQVQNNLYATHRPHIHTKLHFDLIRQLTSEASPMNPEDPNSGILQIVLIKFCDTPTS